VILNEKGAGVKVPRSLDFAAVDGLGVAAARVALGHATPAEAMKEWAEHGLAKLSPVDPVKYDSFLLGLMRSMSGALGPALDLATNQNTFGGKLAKEQPGGRAGVHPAYNGRDTTAQPFKDLAEWLADTGTPGTKDIAPEHYKHLLEQYGGGMGRMASGWMSYLDANQPEKDYPNLWPVVGGLIQAPTLGVPRYNKAYEAAKDVARDIASRDGERLTQYLAANPNAQAIADLYKETDRELMGAARTTNKAGLGQKEKTTVTQADRARIQQAFLDRYQELTR